MHEVLHSNLFLVKEHVGMFKAASNFDVYDPESGQMIINCREENLGFLTKMLRFTDYKRMTPFEIILRTISGEPVLIVKRGISLFLSRVDVLDENGNRIGGFKQKFLSIGGAFSVLDANDQPICDLKGKWTSWDFSFRRGDKEFARVSKKWAGLGRELFTSADNYMISINDDVPMGHPIRILVMAAVMCIDFVLKE